MKITKIDRVAIRVISPEIEKALTEVADKFGLKLEVLAGSFTDKSFTPKYSFVVLTEDGFNAEAKKNWDRYAEMFKLDPAWFGQTVLLSGKEEFCIVGLNPKKPKNCIMLERVRDKESFHCPPTTIIGAMTLAKRRSATG
jgi:hypothetical protein